MIVKLYKMHAVIIVVYIIKKKKVSGYCFNKNSVEIYNACTMIVQHKDFRYQDVVWLLILQ